MELKKTLQNLIDEELDNQKTQLLEIEFLKNQIKQIEKNIQKSNEKITYYNFTLKSHYGSTYKQNVENDFAEFINPNAAKLIHSISF